MDMGRKSTKLGQAGEKLTHYALNQMGFERIQRIHTGWKVVRFIRKGIAKVVPHAKVDGDFTAIEPGTGRAVLVEAKLRAEKLRFSDLADHQVEALNAYKGAGALAYVAWISDLAVYVMPWPCLQPRQALTDEQAKEIALCQIDLI